VKNKEMLKLIKQFDELMLPQVDKEMFNQWQNHKCHKCEEFHDSKSDCFFYYQLIKNLENELNHE
jgi:hypothetical protein